MSDEIKLCKDCKFFYDDGGNNCACHAGIEPKPNLYWGGEYYPSFVEVEVQREGRDGKCGPEGKLFQPRPTLWRRFVEFVRKMWR